MRFYFLLEEYSMTLFLRDLLLRMFPHLEDERDYFLRHHEGKDDLKKAIPNFIKGVASKSAICIVILHDQDDDNCTTLKTNLKNLCSNATVPILIPIPCQELEAWYLGDTHALSQTYRDFKSLCNKRAFKKDPDTIKKPSSLIRQHIPIFSKTDAARSMGKFINFKNNKSKSFNYFVERLKAFVETNS